MLFKMLHFRTEQGLYSILFFLRVRESFIYRESVINARVCPKEKSELAMQN